MPIGAAANKMLDGKGKQSAAEGQKANQFREAAQHEAADKLMDASRAVLDVVFPDSEAAAAAALQKVAEVNAWLADFERNL